MRIFAISDLHGDAELSSAAAQNARRQGAEAVLIAGDLSRFGAEFEGVIAPFSDLGVPVLFVGGNHDDHDRMDALARAYGAVHLDGYGLVIGGIGFIGTRGLNIGADRQSGDEITDSLERAARYAQAETLVSMTHGHPSGTHMASLSRYVRPSGTIETVIRSLKPAVHLCGHVHEGAGLVETIDATKVVNVSHTPTIIDI